MAIFMTAMAFAELANIVMANVNLGMAIRGIQLTSINK